MSECTGPNCPYCARKAGILVTGGSRAIAFLAAEALAKVQVEVEYLDTRPRPSSNEPPPIELKLGALNRSQREARREHRQRSMVMKKGYKHR